MERGGRGLRQIGHIDPNGPGREVIMTVVNASYISISQEQINCLAWVARGKSAAEVALELGISVDEVEVNLETACGRLGVLNPLEAAIVCTQIGVI